MNTEVAQLNPSSIWENFEKLNAVPRPSKNEERVIAFMKGFGESLGLETQVDGAGNVVIRKPATSGMENRKMVTFQSHLDMVHQKNSDTDFDFDTQGIQSYIDAGWVKARGTTLGADNGMGVASMMAILQSNDVEHGPIECLFTIDEETGMTGAFELKPGFLQGEILLNTDTEDEGELCIGCAGGMDTNISMEYPEVAISGGKFYKLTVKGLLGGHSGCDIHLGRGNANKLMNRLMWNGHEKFGMQIVSIDGGSLRNAIPRESFATVVVDEDKAAAFEGHVHELTHVIQQELKRTEPNLEISATSAEGAAQGMHPDFQKILIQAIYASPCGVIRWSDEMPGLVETSTSLARVHTEGGKALIQFLSRSSVESAKDDLGNMIGSIFMLAGADVEHTGGYPGWNPNADSDILRIMRKLYEELFDKEPVVNAVHAGLECGIIGSHYPNMDMISFGPTIKNPHSPDEKCEIESVEKYWKFLLATLKRIPEKN